MKRLTPRTRRRPARAAAPPSSPPSPLLPLLPLLLGALAALAAPPAARAEVYWLDGYEVEVSLRPARPSFVVGEPVDVSLDFENRSDTDLELLLSGERGPGWPDDFEVRVTGPDGETLPRPAPEEGGREAAYMNSYIGAARNHSVARLRTSIIVPLAGWAKVGKPGRYTVTLRRGVRAGPRAPRYKLFPGTTKPAVELSLRTEFEVVGGDGDPLGKLIEELGAAARACDVAASAAVTRLAAIRDARVVRHMAGVVAKCRNAGIRYEALGALAWHGTDEALAALRLAASDADEDLRTDAAQALTVVRRPEARPLLTSLRKDPYYGVRMVVLVWLEGLDTAEARRHIWEMTNDAHPMVRAEALRFTQERSGHPPRP
ncbi:MAG TPA: hypothetical protein VF668_17610 [Pyrinomonadaceae bacterium]|jgi:hypothetical protein